MQNANLAFAEGDQPNARKLQAFEQSGNILLIAREPGTGSDLADLCVHLQSPSGAIHA